METIRKLEDEFKELNKKNKKLEKEIAKVTKIADARLCDSCRQEHPIDVMCPPHEVRMRGDMWYHKMIQKLDAKNKELVICHKLRSNEVEKLKGASSIKDEIIDGLGEEIRRLTNVHNEYVCGKDKQYHDVWCSADRRQPMGCEMCSCTIGKELKKLRAGLKNHVHTQQCWEYAANTARQSGCYECIADCADSYRDLMGGGKVEKTDDDFRVCEYCEYCGCNTIEKIRVCCDAGRDVDELRTELELKTMPISESILVVCKKCNNHYVIKLQPCPDCGD